MFPLETVEQACTAAFEAATAVDNSDVSEAAVVIEPISLVSPVEWRKTGSQRNTSMGPNHEKSTAQPGPGLYTELASHLDRQA